MKKNHKSKYIIANIIIGTIILMLVFSNKAKASIGTVTTETLNLRKEPSTSSAKLELLNEGDEVKIISEEGNWYKVQFKDKEGYVSKDYVAIEDGQEIPQEPTSTPSEPEDSNNTNKTDKTDDTNNPNDQSNPNTVEQDNNIRANTTIKLDKDVTIKILPLINSNNLGNASAGEEITVITTANNWAFVQTNEISGWIVKDSSVGQTIQNEPQENEDNSTGNNEENNGSDNEENNTNNNDDHNNSNGNNSENSSNSNEGGTNYEQSVTKYINGSSVYMRSEPSTSSDVVTILIKNTDVTVTGESGDWYKVKFDEYSGYIYKELLSNEKIVETNRSNSHRENTNNLKENSSTTNLGNGENITTNTSSKGNEIVEYAKQYLGCPYVYGGSGSKSFDCSGFTMYVYKNFGYSLSHSATAQSKVGEYVAKENLQPGDLVFFLDYETMDGIGHCGIYIGDGNFIHASSGSGYCVKISTLTSGSYLKRYATARRLI